MVSVNSSVLSASKVAVTSLAALIVTSHSSGSGSLAQPLQETNSEPPEAAAVSVTLVPSVYSSSQSPPQPMPAGELVTVPVPVPPLLTLRLNLGIAVKVAVTELLASIVKLQGLVPVQALAEPVPLEKPANSKSSSGLGTKVNSVPSSYFASQSSGSPPSTSHSTVPSPTTLMVSLRGPGSSLKVAVTVCSWSMTSSQSAGSQSPPNSTNSEPSSASA